MNSLLYQMILEIRVRSAHEQLKFGRNCILQQDNDPKHTSKHTEWVKKYISKVLEWPMAKSRPQPH